MERRACSNAAAFWTSALGSEDTARREVAKDPHYGLLEKSETTV